MVTGNGPVKMTHCNNIEKLLLLSIKYVTSIVLDSLNTITEIKMPTILTYVASLYWKGFEDLSTNNHTCIIYKIFKILSVMLI